MHNGRRRLAAAAAIVPYFLSGLFFLSQLFTIFAPLPLLFLYLKRSRRSVWTAIFTNSIMVTALGGIVSLGVYLVLVVALSLALPLFFFEKRFKVDKAVFLTLLVMWGVGIALVLGYWAIKGVHPVQAFRGQVSMIIDQLVQLSPDKGGAWEIPPDKLKEMVIREFPFVSAVVSLVMVWLNLILLIRLNFFHIQMNLGLDLSFISKWKAPEFLIWPTILAGGLMIFQLGAASLIGGTIFKFMMAVYGIQGLSILCYFFDSRNIQGFFRSIGYVLAVWPLLPALLGLGFFDLWFDFRSKLGQSKDPAS